MTNVVTELVELGVRYTVVRLGQDYYKVNDETNDVIECTPEENKLYANIERLKMSIGPTQIQDELEIEDLDSDEMNITKVGRIKKWKELVVIYTLILSTLSPIFYDVHKEKDTVHITLEEDENLYSKFRIVIDENKTINKNLRADLMEYADILIEANLSKENYEEILSNLANNSYTNVDELDKPHLAELFVENKNKNFIAEELYNYRHNISVSENKKYQLVANVLSFKPICLNLLFEGVDVANIISIVYGLDFPLNLENDSIKKHDGKELSEYLISLEPNMFGRIGYSCHLSGNIFNPYLCVFDEAKKCYYYFDKETLVDSNTKVYYKKLFDLLMEKETLDYDNKKDRDLLYLYANVYTNRLAYYSENPVIFIFGGTKDISSCYNEYDLMSYLSGYDLDISHSYDLVSMLDIHGYDAIPLIQEVNLCLKKDLEEGYISKKNYEDFISLLREFIENYLPESLDEFNGADEKNTSIGNFKVKIIENVSL